MRKENFQILFISLTILFLINFTPASDSQLYQACGGDAQMTIGCLGDSQIFFIGSAATQSQNIPTLTIINPKNKTYINNQSIPLTYQASNEESVWYNLDLGNNITITHSTNFNTNEGAHILYIYANNSIGEISQNVSFTVNSTKFKIIDSDYNSSLKGSSTNFSNYPYEELQNLSNLILENVNYGKISFNQNINLTDTENPSTDQINLDDYTNISSNRIEINSTALPNLDKPATLSLYGLSFSNPRILKDGNVCPDPVCTENSYSEGILTFNVTGFSVYSSEETPSSSSSGTNKKGGSTGGTITTIPTPNFNINPNELSISILQGEVKMGQLTITNEEDTPVNIEIHLSSKIQNLVRVLNQSFTLNSKGSTVITIDFIAVENLNPDLYFGAISITSSNGADKEIPIIINVQSKGALLDVSSSIPVKYQKIGSGESLLAQINLLNLGSQSRVDVSLEYIIKDFDGDLILNQNETLAVQTQAGFVKTFVMPEDIEEGKYILYIRAVYNGQVASASSEFEIRNISNNEKVYIIIITFLVIIITGLMGKMIVHRKKNYKQIKKADLEDLLWR